MKLIFLAVLVSLAGFCLADLKKIEGTWHADAGHIGENPLPKSMLEKMVLIIKDGTYDYDEGHGHDLGDLKTVEGQSNAMDIVGTKGPNKGKTYHTIFKLEGKKLVIAYGLDGKRPKSFDDKSKTLMVLTYVQPKP